MIKLGNNDIDIKIGSITPKMYMGSVEIYSGDTPPVQDPSLAILGDILLYDVSEDMLVSTINREWDATTYSTSAYEPIAINIYPSNQTPDGKGRWMSLKWMSNASESGSPNSVDMMWGSNGDNKTSKDTNAFNGRTNTDAALLLADGTSANTQSAFPIFYATNIFHTNGTSAGDWYVPSYKELTLYLDNGDIINSQITKIKNANPLIVNDVEHALYTSTELMGSTVYYMGIGFMSDCFRNESIPVRGMLSI